MRILMGVKLQRSVILMVLACSMLAVLGMARPAPNPGGGEGTNADTFFSKPVHLPPTTTNHRHEIKQINTTIVAAPPSTNAAPNAYRNTSTVDARRFLVAVNRSGGGMDNIKGGRDMGSDIVVGSGSAFGSKPPVCENKCGICTPCFPIQIPVGSVHTEEEYYPEVWRCECNSKFYNP